MGRARRAIQQPSRWPLLAAVAAAMAVLAGGIYLAIGRDQGSAGPPATPATQTADPGHHAPAAAPTTSTPASTTDSAARAAPGPTGCAAEVATGHTLLSAVQVAAGHWSEHVRARSDLLAGRNTQEQTKAIWKRTRLAGPADLARVATAEAAYQQTFGRCRALTDAATADCKAHAAGTDAAIVAGRAATGDWSSHLAMMAQHAAGEFGAEHAQSMWLQAWEHAPANLNRFAQTVQQWKRTPACALN